MSHRPSNRKGTLVLGLLIGFCLVIGVWGDLFRIGILPVGLLSFHFSEIDFAVASISLQWS